VLEWLQRPLPEGMTLTYFSLLEPFITSMQIASFFGLVLAARSDRPGVGLPRARALPGGARTPSRSSC
jgi:hypothetical protein